LIEDYIFHNLSKEFYINFNNVNHLKYNNTNFGYIIENLLNLLIFVKYKININNILISNFQINRILNLYISLIRDLYDKNELMKEIKNKPSFFIYTEL